MKIDHIWFNKLDNNTMNNGLLGYFENTWLEVGQFSPAMWSVLERDGNRTNNRLEEWHSKFNAGP